MSDAMSSSSSSSGSSKPASDGSSCIINEVISNNTDASSQIQPKTEQEEEEGEYEGMYRFTLKDEIVILKGMVEYKRMTNQTVKGASEVSEFKDYMTYRLSDRITPLKLGSKIGRLKNKYRVMSWKKKNGVEIKGRDGYFYELSLEVWGDEGGPGFRKRAGLRSGDEH